MRIIDLLNKIANKEELPRQIKIYDEKLRLDENNDNYLYEECDEYYGNELIHWFNLNTEVEIIEEDNKVENIQKIQQRTDTGLFGSMVNDEIKVAEAINKQANYLSDIVSTINEIIDKINEER